MKYIANFVSDDNAPQYCVVTEMSDGGMRIHAIEYRIPDEFVLRLTRHRYAKAYRVIWRSARKIGAELIGPVDSIEPYRSGIRAAQLGSAQNLRIVACNSAEPRQISW